MKTFLFSIDLANVPIPPFLGLYQTAYGPFFDWGSLIGSAGPQMVDAQGPQVALVWSALVPARSCVKLVRREAPS